MLSRCCLIFTMMLLLCSPAVWSYTATCYPDSAAYHTGSTDGVTLTEASLVRSADPEDGWMRFNTSAIPDDQFVYSIYLHYYVTHEYSPGSPPYAYFTPIDTDPLTADPATLWDEINAGLYGPYYERINLNDLLPGWYNKSLLNGALDDLEANLPFDWFAVGVAAYNPFEVGIDGWAETNVPYIVVQYSPYSSDTYYVDDDAPGDPGPGTPSVSDPQEDGSVDHPFDAIQEAVSIAANGDTILVHDGTYTGAGNRGIQYAGPSFTLRSINGLTNCIVDCQHADGFIRFHELNTPDTVVQGLTIRNSPDGDFALYCGNDSAPTIIGNVLENNDGGGIFCSSGSTPRIEDNLVTGNGGTGTNGAGIHCLHGNPLILNNVITGNSGGLRGGGIYVRGVSTATITGNVISGNEASIGGGINIENGEATLNNNLIHGHSTNGSGGGVFCSNGIVDLKNNTITGNSANNGGAIGCADSTVTVTNCIFWNNSPGEVNATSGAAPVITYSDVQGGYSGTGNIHADPLFVTGSEGDYCLSQIAAGQAADSPCIDAGYGQAQNNCYTLTHGTICMSMFSTRTDRANDSGQVDMGFHRPGVVPVTAGLACWPDSGALPMTSTMFVTLSQQSESLTRRIAGRINLTTGGGMYIAGWRAGFTNISPGELFSTSWNQQLPALGSLVGVNTFELQAEDVTPPPYNQPPYPPAGQSDTSVCTVEGLAP